MDFQMFDILSSGIYHSDIAHKGASVSRERMIHSFEIDVPIEEGGISFVDDQSANIVPGLVICAKPGQMRHTKFPFKCYYVHIKVYDERLYEVLMNVVTMIKTDHCEQYCELIKKIHHHEKSAWIVDQIRMQSLVFELIYRLVSDSNRFAQTDRVLGNYYVIENAITYIKENLTLDLSLQSLALRFGYSPTYFHKIFRKATGRALHDYVEEQRIKKAVNMILTSTKTLTQIAYECGFSSQSYFSFAFKRRMKATPREYAKITLDNYEKNHMELVDSVIFKNTPEDKLE